jgi:hypothetical protein
MDFVLEHWAAAIFLPAVLVGLAVLVLIVKVKDRD